MRTWLVGVGMMFVGMGCCGAAFVGLRTDAGTSEMGYFALLLIGVVIVATTMTMMVRKALIVLADETCLILRVDGICFVSERATTVVPWAAIDSVCAQGNVLVIDTDDPNIGQIRMAAQFLDVDARALADLIKKTRRRALMGMF
ncbi:MAG: hypothetical protein ACI9U2_002474 [Bradymonadia bacterium]|jgi:hypothetical protein